MPTRFNPFPRLDCRRGAPMGRHSTAAPFQPETDLCATGPVFEYDPGGAYWGLPPRDGREGPVYAVWHRGRGREGVRYVRAFSKTHAIQAAKETPQ